MNLEKEEIVKNSKWLKQLNDVKIIKKEILDFGVSQFQILKLIESLSLELEDRSTMLAIKDAVQTAIEVSEIELQEQKEIIL
jgi:hypothetical protein